MDLSLKDGFMLFLFCDAVSPMAEASCIPDALPDQIRNVLTASVRPAKLLSEPARQVGRSR
jgi:hypothetical protein